MSGFNLLCTTSLHAMRLAGAGADEPELSLLEDLIEYAARLLPAEGPISGFTFLNPLHAFEGLPFDDAVREGTRLFGCRCYLTEERYRAELARDRIQTVDLRSILEADDRSKPWAMVGGLVSRLDLRLQMLLTPMAVGSDAAIRYAFAENRLLDRFTPVSSQTTRARVVEDAKRWAVRDLVNRPPAADHILRPLLPTLAPLLHRSGQAPSIRQEDGVWEAFALRALWEVCLAGVRSADAPPVAPARPARPRDALRAATPEDPDALVHNLLIRFCAAFCDQGQAGTPPPTRADGFLGAFPIVVRPRHWVKEEVLYHHKEHHQRTARLRRLLGLTASRFMAGTRGLGAGAVASAGVGWLASVPLVARVMFPRLCARITRAAASLVSPPAGTRLTAERAAPTPGSEGDHRGFALEERASIAERVLRFIGLTRGFSRLVMLFGHGAQGLNNPHMSAYNCGACSGNAGGPNARLMAAFMNDPLVREVLAARGITIPAATVFLGGQHNTSEDTFTFYDLDVLPRSHWPDLDAARAALDAAAGRNARERCRRFESAPLSITESAALAHVHGRVSDLGQVRPEFGNGTNALCIVGRRSRVRGLFLDRRSFFHSYDPTQDDAVGSILAKILAPTVPVCQGINLEYYFSAVDPAGWGAGTKLPHNVTSLAGVMDGAASDLRQGLPWQGVEIHEPVRLLFVIETTPEVMTRIMENDPWVGRIFRNDWAQLAVLDPHSAEVRVYEKGKFELYHPTGKTLPRVKESAEWYTGQRDNLGFAEVNAGGADNW